MVTTVTHYRWNQDRDAWLRQVRGVSFEQAVMHIEHGDLLDVIRHPNDSRYPHQKVLVVRIAAYVYAVPYVEQGNERFLKTIIPSRKLTRRYLRQDDEKPTAWQRGAGTAGLDRGG